MKVFALLSTRLREPSTYAGLSVLCLAISSALQQVGAARYAALLIAAAAAIAAIAKAENEPALAIAMEDAARLVPVLTRTIQSVEAVLSEQTVKPS